MADANDPQEDLVPDEETVQEPDTESTDVDVEELKIQAAKSDEYKKFADRMAAENKELKKKLTPQEETNTPITDEKYERLNLKIEGYSEDEVNHLMEIGGSKALENPFVKAGIEAERKKAKSLDATPSGTGKSPIYQKYSEEDLKRMPLDELEKIIPQ